MPLVGVIEPGTVPKVLKSVAYAKANVLVLFEQKGRSAHVLYQKGEILTARLDELTGDEAITALKQWQDGHYSLLKRDQNEVESKGHVLLNSLSIQIRRPLERWLKACGFTTSIVGYPQHAQQVISYLKPEVVLMNCPRGALGVTCAELSNTLRGEIGIPPLLIAVESEEHRCPAPDSKCVIVKPSTRALERLLCQAWPSTRFGARQESDEETARVYRPTQLPPEPIQLSVLTNGAESRESEAISAAQLAVVFLVLLLGSAAIWAWWFWSTKLP